MNYPKANYINFINRITSFSDQSTNTNFSFQLDNFLNIYDKPSKQYGGIFNLNQVHHNNKRIIPIYNPYFAIARETAFDDKQKKKKNGIYRVKYEDSNDLDKKGNPKIKFNYFYLKDNIPVTPEDQIRINKLGLAPAYEDVWVSIDPTSKIQATGIDAKGRKQYRYASKHIEEANINKFLRLYKFIKNVHKLNEALDIDSKANLYSKHRTITVMLRMMKELNMRVGKEIYAQKNKSYGVSSLRKSHVKINEDKLVAKLNFKAKSNKQVQYTLNNKDIVKELIELMKLEGDKLFQYKTDTGTINRVTDVDINQYIQNKMGKGFSAKDFRTYAANFYFIKALLKETKLRNPVTQKIAKKNISLAQENTAFYLRHTKSISKKSYTMDLIRDLYMNNPDYFIQNKNKQPLTILLDLLKMFKEKINADKKKNKDTEIDEDKIILSTQEEDDD
jgi:DNA topoisomerase-1